MDKDTLKRHYPKLYKEVYDEGKTAGFAMANLGTGAMTLKDIDGLNISMNDKSILVAEANGVGPESQRLKAFMAKVDEHLLEMR